MLSNKPRGCELIASTRLGRILLLAILLFGIVSFLCVSNLSHSGFTEPIVFRNTGRSKIEPNWFLAGEWVDTTGEAAFTLSVYNQMMVFQEKVKEAGIKALAYKVRWLSSSSKFIGQWTTPEKGGGRVGSNLVSSPRSVFEYTGREMDTLKETTLDSKDIVYRRLGAIPSDQEIKKHKKMWSMLEKKNSVKDHHQIKIDRSKMKLKAGEWSKLAGTYWKQGDRIGFDLSTGQNSSGIEVLYFKENGASGERNQVKWVEEGKVFVGKWETRDFGGGRTSGGVKFRSPLGVFEIGSDGVISERTAFNSLLTFMKDGSVVNEDTPINFDDTDIDKGEAVKIAFLNAWNAYWGHCKGQDELIPLRQKCHNWVNMAATIIDSISTMALMGLDEQLIDVKEYIGSQEFQEKLTQNRKVSVFETTIRVLGGLVSSYDLTGEAIYIERAQELGDRLLRAFQPNGLPLGVVNLRTGDASTISWAKNNVLFAEIMTLQLEFFKLSEYTKDSKYQDAAQRVIDMMEHINQPLPGQFPVYITKSGGRAKNAVSWGAMGDSGFEYLLKLWILTGKRNEQYRRMYVQSSIGMLDNLYTEVGTENAYIAEWNGRKVNKVDHLTCFAGGSLALAVYHGAYLGDEELEKRHMDAADKLVSTCWRMYKSQPSGISPETVTFSGDSINAKTKFYILRPETVESFFYMWRITKQEKWRQYGWMVFKAIEKNCAVPGWGYTPLIDVTTNRKDSNGKMQSFFLAETLKYLYLLFSDDSVISIDDYVFNTEAHPLKVQKISIS